MAFSQSPAIACAVSPITGMPGVFTLLLRSLVSCLPPVHYRQTHVHEDQIGRFRLRHADRLCAVNIEFVNYCLEREVVDAFQADGERRLVELQHHP